MVPGSGQIADLETSAPGVILSGTLSTSSGALVTSAPTIYLSRTATNYASSGADGYVVKVGDNGSWELAGVDQNQSTMYLQIALGGSLYSVKRESVGYSVVSGDGVACGDSCKFSITTADLLNMNLQLPVIGSISGVISGASGPASSGQVCAIAYKDGLSASSFYSGEVGRVCTNAVGAYSLGLPFGSYKVLFQNMPGAPFKNIWHDNIANTQGYSGATSVSLTAGVNASRTINPLLAEGLSIRGSVRDSNGDAISGANVSAMLWNSQTLQYMGVSGTPTLQDGTFILNGLDAGDYTLMSSHPDFGMMYLGGSREDATQFSVIANVEGKNISFPRGYSISGAITTGDSSEARICVAAYLVNESTNMGWGQFVGSNCFSSPGLWKLKGLKPGKYKLRFDAQSGNLRSVFLGGVTDFNSATTTEISNSDIGNIDVNIPAGKSISGKIVNFEPSAVANVCVAAIKQSDTAMGGGVWAASSCTNASGEFLIRGLEDGQYILNIQSPPGTDYTPGYFSEGGSPVKRTEDAQIFDIGSSVNKLSQTLKTGPKFTAIVKAGTTPVSGVCVMALKQLDSFGWGEWSGSSCSGLDGKISLRGLSAGDYKFQVQVNSGNYQSGWFRDAPASTTTDRTLSSLKTISATDVDLGDILLASGTKANGRIVNSQGTAISGACVQAMKDNGSPWGEWAGSTCSQSDGKFTIRGLDPSSSYRFRVDIWAGDYKPGFIKSDGGIQSNSDGITARAAATDIALADITLLTAPSISGLITSGNNQAESGVCVNAHDAITLMWKASSCTQSSGKFYLRGLDPGNYKISWWTQRPTLTNGWYKSVANSATQVVTPEQADTLTIDSDGLSNLSIVLANGGKIFGKITGTLSAVQNICVAAWTTPSTAIGTRENAVAISCADSDSKYELKGLTPNADYYLQAFKKNGDSVAQGSPSSDSAQRTGGSQIDISVS